MLITIASVSFGVGLPAAWIGIPGWTVPAVAVPAVVCVAGLLLLRPGLLRHPVPAPHRRRRVAGTG
ncbi:hypothetical protein [Streptomyces sp. RKAG290]|uniref:hypothetical protein n=1 Tax=Streptomyces sp. RKAG290 TaxID=2888348 RepID=UPI00203469A9|nr:hypothetical protein [Streptomyces sp. RKAG290]MCM2412816.1 hypothetical protein [Streptomyces sp. RKAG290]